MIRKNHTLKMVRLISIFCIICAVGMIFVACGPVTDATTTSSKVECIYQPAYATGFQITYFQDGARLIETNIQRYQ